MAYTSLALIILVLSCAAVSIDGFNITEILAPYPEYSLFNQWLNLTGVANETDSQKSITVLATPNTAFQSYLNSVPNAYSTPALVADTLRYQILLTYFGIAELQKIPVNNYTSVTTVLQTTGRMSGSSGFVDIYHTSSLPEFVVGYFVPNGFGNETIVTNVTESPYSYSILQLSSVLIAPQEAVISPGSAPSPGSSPGSSPAPSLAAPLSSVPTASLGPQISETTPSYASKASASVPLAIMATSMALLLAAL